LTGKIINSKQLWKCCS